MNNCESQKCVKSVSNVSLGGINSDAMSGLGLALLLLLLPFKKQLILRYQKANLLCSIHYTHG